MTASIRVTLHEGPLPAAVGNEAPCGAGAIVTFEGVVRPEESDRPIVALDYEAYEPMTTRELERLASEVAARHGLSRLTIDHSVGRVGVHQCSFRLTAAAAHRAETLAAVAEFIETMKRDVPLWKVAVEA